MLTVTTTLFTLNRRSLLWNRNSLFLSAFDLKMLCILFSYSYPVIRAVKGLQGKKILLQIKDIAEVILSLARLKLSSWYRTKNAIRIKNPYPWHLACVQTPHPPPPIPSVWIREEIFTERREVCTQAVDTKPPPLPHPQEKMLMNSRLQWCIYGYSFSMPWWKETTQRKCFIYGNNTM